jgi:hypothetical protein
VEDSRLEREERTWVERSRIGKENGWREEAEYGGRENRNGWNKAE